MKNKNTVIGFVVIGAIVVAFFIFNASKYRKQVEEQRVRDSVAIAEAAAQRTADSIRFENQRVKDSIFATEHPELAAAQQTQLQGTNPQPAAAHTTEQPIPVAVSMLDSARTAPEQYYTLENEVFELTFSNKGGRMAAARLKDYKKYGGDPLMLFTPGGSSFSLNLFAPHQINTSDYCFEALQPAANQLAFRLYADSASYLEYTYTLRPGDYMLDMRIDLSHFKGTMLANQPDISLAWGIVSPQQEKGFQNENMYSSVYYKFPGETSLEDLGISDKEKSESINTQLQWVAFKQQFFSSIIIAKDNFASGDMKYATYVPGSSYIKKFDATLTLPYTSETTGYDLQFYLGPNKYSTLKHAGADEGLELQKLVPLGWWIIGWVNRFLVIPTFDFLGSNIASFGIVILLLTLLMKLLIFPLTYKSYLSTAKMRLLKPEIDKINEKYPKKEDALKKQQATMGLYKSAGVSPMGGCLPMLIQLPIIIAMFRFFPSSFELRGESFLWAEDLSSYDSIWNLPFSIPFYGDHVSLFTLLMVVSLYISSKINYANQAGMSNQMPGMKFMMLYLMPIMLLFWFNNYAAGLCWYYFLSNVITIGQTYAFRQLVDDDKLHAKMRENALKNTDTKKSKWQQRLEDMQKQQQAAQKQKQQGGGNPNAGRGAKYTAPKKKR